MGIWPKVVGRAGPAACDRDGVQASWDGQGGAEDPGHQLVSRVCVYRRAAGVSLIFPPTVFCEGKETRTVSQHANTHH